MRPLVSGGILLGEAVLLCCAAVISHQNKKEKFDKDSDEYDAWFPIRHFLKAFLSNYNPSLKAFLREPSREKDGEYMAPSHLFPKREFSSRRS